MFFRQAPKILLAVFFSPFAVSAFSQVVPSGENGKFPVTVGVGASEFSLDWGYDGAAPPGYSGLGHRRGIYGGTLWFDWNFYDLPRYLNGLGLEMEAMDLQIAPPVELPGMRHDTAEGGGIYTWRHLAKVRPYGKFLVGFGSMDFPKSTLLRPNGTPYSHDTRTVYAPGGGVNVDITRHVALRVDYESQFWPHFLGHATALTPNGLTVGATYSFSPFHKHGQRSLLE